MTERSFNLITDPWLQVITSSDDSVKTVSLADLFTYAHDYRRLAGEMQAQDLAILRFLLAILHTVYSRYDVQNQPYSWLTLDDATSQVIEVDDDDYEADDVLETWQSLYREGKFSNAVTAYLAHYTERLNLFGEHPFYQVTASEYDALVPPKKRVETGTGTVAIKQINRQISESANSPSLFAPKTGDFKNELSLAELTRWLITYQSFTGVTDKTKVISDEKFSAPAGWLYQLGPVYAAGQNLFETLMLNLDLLPTDNDDSYHPQHPVWEYPSVADYVATRKQQTKPDNVAALYTTWSRLLHLEWSDDQQPTIFSASLPIFDTTNAFIEPMTVWRLDTKAKPPVYLPARKSTRSLSTAMWRNFGQYVNAYHQENARQPGIVDWLDFLKQHRLIARTMHLTLASVALISDGNATSQSPVAESTDDMTIEADVLFDTENANYWPQRIADTIQLTQQIGKDYWLFTRRIGELRNIDAGKFANNESAKFYALLNRPFKAWLAGLTNADDRDEKINIWKGTLRQIVMAAAELFLQSASPRDVKGIPNSDSPLNIFTAYNQFTYKITQDLDVSHPKEATHRAN